jgi:hypothetical protein
VSLSRRDSTCYLLILGAAGLAATVPFAGEWCRKPESLPVIVSPAIPEFNPRLGPRQGEGIIFEEADPKLPWKNQNP